MGCHYNRFQHETHIESSFRIPYFEINANKKAIPEKIQRWHLCNTFYRCVGQLIGLIGGTLKADTENFSEKTAGPISS